MKTRFFLLLAFVLLVKVLTAQVPQGINYQSVVRNGNGDIIVNQNISLRFSVLSGSATGNIVYRETHNTTTNPLGLVNLVIGQGASVFGVFSDINWGSASHFLSVDLDAQGGTAYQMMGTSQLMSVPYALSAGNSSTSMAQLTDVNVTGVTDGQVLKWSVSQSKWIPADIGTGGGSGWNLSGNTGTNATIDFIGTTDAQPINFRTDNTIKTRITTKGQIEILNTGGSVFLGEGAGEADNMNNGRNVFVGYQAGYSNTTGDRNTAVGYIALNNNTTGIRNTAIGHQTLLSNTTGGDNVALGAIALTSNLSGGANIAIGYSSMSSNINGERNVAIGMRSLSYNSSGSGNVAIGNSAMTYNFTGNSTGSENVAIGDQVLRNNSTGNGNTAVGKMALDDNVTGSYITGIGYGAYVDANNRTNLILIAGNSNLSAGGNNRVRIGNSSMTSIGGQVAWTSLSDERIKKNVADEVKGLSFIMKLKPITYNYSISKSNELQGKRDTSDWTGKYDIEKIRFSGFLAQEVEKAGQEAGYSFSGVDKPESETGLWGLRYAEFTVPLVKAVQEQQEMIEKLRREVEWLKGQIK